MLLGGESGSRQPLGVIPSSGTASRGSGRTKADRWAFWGRVVHGAAAGRAERSSASEFGQGSRAGEEERSDSWASIVSEGKAGSGEAMRERASVLWEQAVRVGFGPEVARVCWATGKRESQARQKENRPAGLVRERRTRAARCVGPGEKEGGSRAELGLLG